MLVEPEHIKVMLRMRAQEWCSPKLAPTCPDSCVHAVFFDVHMIRVEVNDHIWGIDVCNHLHSLTTTKLELVPQPTPSANNHPPFPFLKKETKRK